MKNNLGKFEVRKQWLYNKEENAIASEALGYWFSFFDIEAVDSFVWFSHKMNKFIDIEIEGGYGLGAPKLTEYWYKDFFVGNADLDRWKLRLSTR